MTRTHECTGYEDWKLHEEAGQTDWAEDDPDKNYAERFISGLLRKLLPGFEARDRTVRYRTLFFASKIVPKLIKLKYVAAFCALS